MTSNKSHNSSPHSHKPCPPGAGSNPPAADVSLNGSRGQQSISRYRPRAPGPARAGAGVRWVFTSPSVLLSADVDMEVDHFTNGVTESSSNGFLNGSSKHATEPDDCEADMGGWSPLRRAR